MTYRINEKEGPDYSAVVSVIRCMWNEQNWFILPSKSVDQ